MPSLEEVTRQTQIHLPTQTRSLIINEPRPIMDQMSTGLITITNINMLIK